ncbi:MAG: PAS domain S-box protein, partial [Anaerolineales bacterium]|nr:PAS domain S-box protein [Anaerolineales bacterium]
MTRLTRWLRPPRLADEAEARRAEVLNGLLLVLLGLSLIAGLLAPFLDPPAALTLSGAALGGAAVLGLRGLLFRGHVRAASALTVLGLWLLLTLYFSRTAGGPGYAAYGVVILAGGLLLGEGLALATASLSALAVYLLLAGDGLAGPELLAAPWADWLLPAAAFFSVAGLLILARPARPDDRQTEAAADYRRLFESCPQPMWVVDRETRALLAVNAAAAAHLGYTEAELLRLTVAALQPTPGRCRKKDGTVSDVELITQPTTFAGRPAEMVLLNDASARRLSEERFQRMVEASPMGVHLYQLEPDGRLVFRGANPAADRLLGIDHAALIGLTLEAAFPALVQTEIPARYRAVAGQGGHWQTAQVDYQDGRIAGAFEVHAFQAEPGRLAVWFRDVTERQRSEQQLRISEASYRGLLDSLTETIYIQDQEGRFLDVNRAAEAMYGYPRERFIGQTPEFLAAPGRNDLAAVGQAVQRALAGAPQRFEFWGRRNDGTVFPKEVSLTPGTYFGQAVVIAVARDISERKQAETALRESEARTRALLENGGDAIAILDERGALIYASPSTMRVLGYALEAPFGQNSLAPVHADDLPEVLTVFHRLLETPGQPATVTFRYLHHDGSWRWLEATGANLLTEPAVRGLVVNYRDITDRRHAEAQRLYDAFHDPLTGLPNRALFADRLEQAIRRSHRHDGYAFAVLFLDIDRFKVINDSLGHPRGDQLLTAAARRLERVLRAADTLARLSGDEFVILLDDVHGADEAAQIAGRLQEQLSAPFDLGGLEVITSASIGVVLSEAGYERADEMLRDADIAMYRAKALGKARHELFQASMRVDAVARLGLEADLRRALERGELRVHYQPIVALADGRLTGFEALVRWQHPERGLEPPARFVPVAEDTGLIIPIDRWVLQQAAVQVQAWQTLQPVQPLSVNVNISGRHFVRPDLAAQIEASLAVTGLAPSQLRLEITESVIMENIDLAVISLQQLHALGVQIEIDDFGTGYSSLGYLVQLPVDTLKIDRSFVRQMNAGKAEVIHTIVNLARNLGLRTI